MLARPSPSPGQIRKPNNSKGAGGALFFRNPRTRIGNGGLDANWLVRNGVPTVTFGAGQHNIHTIEEYVDLPEFYQGCAMALALATFEG